MTTHINRLKCSISNAPGVSGALTIAAAASGFRTFGAAHDGMTVDCLLLDGTAWEVRTGCVYTHATTSLSRGTLEDSSTGAAIDLTSATQVLVTMSAGMGNALANQINRGVFLATNDGTATQSVTNSTYTRLTAINTEVYDQLSWYDSANQKFQPNIPGFYLIGMAATINLSLMAYVPAQIQCIVRKNGGTYVNLAYANATQGGANGYRAIGASGSVLVYLNGSTDYVEPYVWHNASAANPTLAGANFQYFYGSYWSP